jgi:hypothetical protein
MNKYFDPLAMIHPKNDRDISAMLAEALNELRSINAHLEAILELPVTEHA